MKENTFYFLDDNRLNHLTSCFFPLTTYEIKYICTGKMCFTFLKHDQTFRQKNNTIRNTYAR